MAKVFLRCEHNYDTKEASDSSALVCREDEDMAQQSFKDECDINVICERFGITGEFPDPGQLVFGDFSDVSDFHSAVNAVREASETFMLLPGKVREYFNHDAQKFINFWGDGGNFDEAVRLGLVPAKAAPVAPPIMQVRVVPDAPEKAPGGAGPVVT